VIKMEKKKLEIPLSVYIFGTLILIALIISGLIYWIGSDDEYITVEGKIIDVDLKESSLLGFDILIITFDNGETYHIANTLGRDVDFTVNSKFIIKLFRSDVDSYWTIEQIYRVPE